MFAAVRRLGTKLEEGIAVSAMHRFDAFNVHLRLSLFVFFLICLAQLYPFKDCRSVVCFDAIYKRAGAYL